MMEKDSGLGHLLGSNAPYMSIIEQPKARDFRFRYKCEGTSHGGIQGENSQRDNKTFPRVKIHNYTGPACITVTLATNEKVARVHAHELVGKNCDNGICAVRLNGESMEVCFPNLSVQHVTKRQLIDELTQRHLQLRRIDREIRNNAAQGDQIVSFDDYQYAATQAQSSASEMKKQLNVVCLKFQAYLLTPDNRLICMLPPVISQPIYDCKAAGAATLKISRINQNAGCCSGNDEVFLLCDRVQKDDIAVRFYELKDGVIDWQADGIFGSSDVHRQYAIVFQTPAYRDVNIQRPVNVLLQLRRIKSDETSDSITFTYHPQHREIDEVARKRKKTIFGSITSDFAKHASQSMPVAYSSQPVPTDPFSHRQWLYTQMTRRGLLSTETITTTTTKSQATTTSQMMIDVAVENPMSDEASLSPAYCMYSDDITDVSSSEMINRSVTDPVEKQKPESKKLTERSAEGKASVMQGGALSAASDKSQSVTEEESEEEEEEQGAQMDPVRAEAFQNYARTGNPVFVLLQDRHLLSVSDKNGDTVIHLAIINKKLEALANIIDAHPFADSLNQYNKLQQTPLHLATLTNQPEMLDFLLGKVDVSLVDRHGDTCFHIASRYGYEQCLRKLLHAAEPKEIAQILKKLNLEGISAVHEAVISGHVKLLELLLTSGGDVNLPDGRSGRTPLHYATEIDNRSAAELLVLQDSLKVDAVTFDGNTALHLAVGRGNLIIATMLIASGADPEAENDQLDTEDADNSTASRTGQTPLDLAANNQQMLRILRGEKYSSVIDDSSPSAQQMSP